MAQQWHVAGNHGRNHRPPAAGSPGHHSPVAGGDRRIGGADRGVGTAGRKTPQNSSLPPSTQHPHAKPASPKRKSKKKRGGQPGHEKHERPLIPTDQCDDVQPLKPTECRRCGEKLSGSDPEPLRHQVWELPEIKPHVTEYQRHRLVCPCCGETTCAELPAGVPQGQAGPRLMAFVALLMAYYRQSKRRTAEFLETMLAATLLPGLTVKNAKPSDRRAAAVATRRWRRHCRRRSS